MITWIGTHQRTEDGEEQYVAPGEAKFCERVAAEKVDAHRDHHSHDRDYGRVPKPGAGTDMIEGIGKVSPDPDRSGGVPVLALKISILGRIAVANIQ